MTNYVFKDDLEKAKVESLTSDQRIKLKLYELHLQDKRIDQKERESLIIYMAEHDLDAGLIRYL